MAEQEDTSVDEGAGVRAATRHGLGEITPRPEANLRGPARRPSGTVPPPRRSTTVPPPIPAKARAQTQQLPSIVNKQGVNRAPSSAGIAVARTQTGERAASSSAVAVPRTQSQQLPSIVNRAPSVPPTERGTSSSGIAVARTQTGERAASSRSALPRTPTELGAGPGGSRQAPSVQPRPSGESLEPMRRRPQATPAIPSAEAARSLAAARAIEGSTSDALRDLVTTAAGVRAPTASPVPPPAPLAPPPMPLGRESARAIAAAHDLVPDPMPRESSQAIAAAHAVVADPAAESESAQAIAAARNARPRTLTPIESITSQLSTAPAVTTAEALREVAVPTAVRPATIPSIATTSTVRAQTAPVGSSSVPGLLASMPALAAAPTVPVIAVEPISAPPVKPPAPSGAAVLPPYVPAPNVGDPGEAFATVPVEKIEFTEHVEKLPFTLEDLDDRPRVLIPARTPLQRLVGYAPWIGVAALLAVFAIGYVVFDGEGKQPAGAMTHVSAPSATHVVVAQPAEPIKAAATAVDVAATPAVDHAAVPTAAVEPSAADPSTTSASPQPEPVKAEPTAPSTTDAVKTAPSAVAKTPNDEPIAKAAKPATEPTPVAKTEQKLSAPSSEPTPVAAKTDPVMKPESKPAAKQVAAVAKPATKSASDAVSAAKLATKPAAKQVAAVAATPAPKGPRGTLAVTSNKKLQVYLDGKSANTTTPFKLQLAAGTHKLTLWDTASGKTQTIQVTVTAGKTTAIDKRF